MPLAQVNAPVQRENFFSGCDGAPFLKRKIVTELYAALQEGALSI